MPKKTPIYATQTNKKQNFRIIKMMHPFRSWEIVYVVEYKKRSLLFGHKWKCLFTTGEKYYFETLKEAEERLETYLEVIATYDY